MKRGLESLHHANLLIGNRENGESYFLKICGELGISLANNPDYFVFRQDVFGIDEARFLKSRVASMGVTDGKFFLIMPMRLTLEAENALLKTFEDPPPHNYFFLVLKEESLVGPTLLSRMKKIVLHANGESNQSDAKSFLKLPIRERLQFAGNFAEEGKNLPVFLDDLLLFLKKEEKPIEMLEKVYEMRKSAFDQRVSARLIIEHLAMVL